MALKGVIQADHVALNSYELTVLGLPKMTFTSVKGIEEKLDVVKLPDRTSASGGRTQPITFTVTLPMHHAVEQAAMELWFLQSKDPVQPGYKRPATFLAKRISENVARSFTLTDVFPSNRKVPDFEMDNDGEMADIEWTLECSSMLPI